MTDTVEDGNAVFLQPNKVGSSVRYHVSVGGAGAKAWCEGAVYLTDCERKICWHGDAEDLVLKIDVAAKMLQEARSKVVAAMVEAKKRKKVKS